MFLVKNGARLFSFLLVFITFCPLQSIAEGSDSVSALRNAWDIDGPNGIRCLGKGIDSTKSSDSGIGNSIACEDSSSVLRMEYNIHKNAKYPKARIYQKDCNDQFEAGTAPIQATVLPEENGTVDLLSLPLSTRSDTDDAAIASIEILPNKDFFVPSWWQRFASSEKPEYNVEFCIRMGLWLAPEAGNLEVNFRETNVSITFVKISTDKTSGNDYEYVMDSFVLTPKKMVSINVVVGGTKVVSKNEEGGTTTDASIAQNAEL